MKFSFHKLLQVLIVCVIILSVVLVIVMPTYYNFSKIAHSLFGDAINAKGELTKLIITVAGGGLLFYGLILNARRTSALELQNGITEKGHVDERFKNAIEHLGNTNPAITLGGIYALHRIAKDNYSYRQTVFDILCSYLRETTSTPKALSEMTEGNDSKPPIIIQTILDLLFKPEGKEYIYKGFNANLTGIKCNNANLNKACLQGANLTKAYLQGADLSHALLQLAHLTDAHFEGANLWCAHLEDASIRDTHFKGADLEGAHFEISHLMEADSGLTYSEMELLRIHKKNGPT